MVAIVLVSVLALILLGLGLFFFVSWALKTNKTKFFPLGIAAAVCVVLSFLLGLWVFRTYDALNSPASEQTALREAYCPQTLQEFLVAAMNLPADKYRQMLKDCASIQAAVAEAPPVVATSAPPQAQSAPLQPPVEAKPPANEFVPYDQAGGIPYNGTTWSVDVAPDELEVFTAGPACIAGVCLPGGITRGSVIILLPGKEVVPYTVTGVIAGANWHGSYRPFGDPAAEATWRALANDRILAMQQAPNCTPGTGCKTIDVLVVGPGPVVVAQWTVSR